MNWPSYQLGEAGEGGGFGVEGGDGFDKASDSEGIADAAGTANEVESSVVARQLDRNANKSGDAGTVDLKDAVERDDHLASAALDDGIEGLLELLTGLADGEPAVNINNRHTAGIAGLDLQRSALRHCVQFESPISTDWHE